ncbi:MAG: hypothetical protein U0Z44_01200 [Kouleothrix sp.]
MAPLLAAVGAVWRAPEQAMPLALLILRFTRVALPSAGAGADRRLPVQSVCSAGRPLGATTYGRALGGRWRYSWCWCCLVR